MRRIVAVLSAWALAAGLASGAPPEAFESRARERVAALVEAAHEARTDPGLGAVERAERMRAAVASAFALDLWLRAVLGERAEALTPAERAEIEALLPAYLAALYLDSFGAGAAPPVVGEVEPARRDVLVAARLPRASAEDLELLYRVREVAGEARVLDVLVGGVSFALLKRDQFRSILEAEGPARLIEVMRDATR